MSFTPEGLPQQGLKFERFFAFLDECQASGKDPIEYAREKGLNIKNEYSETIQKILNPRYRDQWNASRFEMISKIDKELNPECQGKEGCNSLIMRTGFCNTGLCTKRILKEIEKLESQNKS